MVKLSKDDDVKQRLINAAGHVFAEVGYEGATVRQITDRAEANVAAINYYFHDKLQLYRIVLKAATEKVVQSLNKNCREGAPKECLRQFVHSIVTAKTYEDYPWSSALMSREIAELHEEQAEFIVDAVRPMHMIAEEIIAKIAPDAAIEQVKLSASLTITLCVHRIQQQRIEQRLSLKTRYPSGGLEVIVDSVYRFALAGIVALCRSVP